MTDEHSVRIRTIELQIATALERIANHIESNKRIFERIEATEKDIVEMREQIKAIVEFHATLKRILLTIATGGAVAIWYFVQRVIENR